MGKILSETRPGQVMDIILTSVVLLAIIDYFGVINITTPNIYIFLLITPLGFLRLYVDYRYKNQPAS